jgi:Effector-associated domain 11
MSTLNDVRSLVSENKIEEALDLLQGIVESKNDDETLDTVTMLKSRNKTYKLKELADVTLSIQELNDIKHDILVLCGELKKEDGKPRRRVENSSIPAPQSQSSFFDNPMVKYGAIGIGILIVLFIIGSLGGGSDITASNDTELQSQKNTPPITANANNGSVNWHASPNTITVKEKGYNDMKIEIANISCIDKTADTKLVTIVLKLECIDKNVDVCVENDLKYVFKNPTNQVNSSSETTTETRFDVGTSMEHKIDFEVPKGMHEANLEIYYIRKLKQTFKVEF